MKHMLHFEENPALVGARWLVLLYQLSARSSSARVRVWRRLQDIGAVQVRQSAYVLPNRGSAREDLEWLKSEIVGLGGAATLLTADGADAATDAELVAACRDARARDAAHLRKRATRWLARSDRTAARVQPLPAALAREARALATDWRALTAVTYFDTPGMPETEEIMQQIVQRSSGRRADSPATPRPGEDIAQYRGRTWATRTRPGVDRMATAWLIRTHIDPQATFVFGDPPPVDAVPFDMFGVAFGHHGDRCTFEVVADHFGLRSPRVAWISRIVHDIDLRVQHYNEPETAGVALMIDGLRRTHADDASLLDRGIGLFESLAQAHADSAVRPASPPAPGRLRAPRTPGVATPAKRRSAKRS
jgi:hypothetical protein